MTKLTVVAALAAFCVVSCAPKVPVAPAGAALFDDFSCDATELQADGFETAELDSSWMHRHSALKDDVPVISLTECPGYLTMQGHKGFFLDETNMSMLAQKLTDSVFTAQTRVIMEPVGSKSAAAGLVLMKSEQQRLFLSVCEEGVKLQHMELIIEMIEGEKPRVTEDVETLAEAPLAPHSFVDLKAECDGHAMNCSYSVDGKKWAVLAEDVDASFLKAREGELRGPKVCLTVLK